MEDKDCIFCKIAKGEIPAMKFWEDKNFIAILDIAPNSEGQALVISKDHYPSNIVDESEELFISHFIAARKVAKLMDRNLKVKRTAIVLEGMGVNHAHIKLYPLHGLSDDWMAVEADERVFFEKYEGYVTTKMGPVKSPDELRIIKERLEKL
jgi:diadenosine tetraphosphate (Ap4A) HIT family hydrolase